ncbi:hypothetical protein Q4525_08855 [Shimia thalassica]|uniref:alpha/beta hydrolase n=1 Tax=Shimia thalassica TaxID=1715693 RepID=UPI001C083566|nr:hypothetical protein [Shimia thalassica]MBU2941998.1 hypothetical protein [Shimia thalassica]MDO6503033.1 hypothetical protein [Shimia thalassica]
MRVINDITYDRRQPNGLALDLYLPKGPARASVLFAHGGGFYKGARADAAVTRLAQILTDHDLAMASASYRLGTKPEAFSPADRRLIQISQTRTANSGLSVSSRLCGSAFEAARQDLGAALGWMRAAHKAHGIHSEKVGFVGVSAGGIAGLALAYPPRFLPECPRPDAVFAVSACAVQPWRLTPHGPPCVLLNNDRDKIIRPENPRLTQRRARGVGAPVKSLWCDRKGHNAPFLALLEDRDPTAGRPYTDHLLTLFDSL